MGQNEQPIKDSTLFVVPVDAQKASFGRISLDELTVGTYITTIDSGALERAQHQSVSELITQKTSVFVKSYGVNGLATLTFRGASAAQSTVLWNGVPVLNPMSGMADISFIRAGLFEQVGVLLGGNGALFGSGNVGGALLLQSYLPSFSESYGAEGSLNVGSFGRYDVLGKGFYENKKGFFSAKVYYHQSENNFSYKDYNFHQREMDHARSQAYGAMIDGGVKVNTKQQLQLSLWYQEAHREIPPALFETISSKLQVDRFLKANVQWKWEHKKHFLWLNEAYGWDAFSFTDSLIFMSNKAISHQIYHEFGWRWQAHENHTLYIFSPVQFSWANATNYNGTPWQIRLALVANYRFLLPNQKVQVLISARQELWNERLTPFLPSLGLEFYPIRMLKIYVSAQRSYRVPALNELFYFPGGNSNLRPEKGWNVNAGVQFSHVIENRIKVRLLHQVNGFSRWVNDWIYWMGGSVWTPHNIAQVFSAGGEINHAVSLSYKKWVWRVNIGANYIVSITQRSDLPNDGSIGKQIPYTPKWNGNGGLAIEWNGISLAYDHQLTGERFVTVDESQMIPWYHLGNIHLHYTWRFKTFYTTAGVEVYNLWNEDYQIMWQRPMPGRYFMGNIKIGFRKN